MTGYACDPLMAEVQFTQAKAEYYQKTGRRRGSPTVIFLYRRAMQSHSYWQTRAVAEKPVGAWEICTVS